MRARKASAYEVICCRSQRFSSWRCGSEIGGILAYVDLPSLPPESATTVPEPRSGVNTFLTVDTSRSPMRYPLEAEFGPNTDRHPARGLDPFPDDSVPVERRVMGGLQGRESCG